jgi:predicted transcriptional regulator
MGIGKSLEKKIEQSAHRRSVDIISVLVEITKYPCAKIGKIAQNLNTTPGTVRWYLKKLCNEKILVCKKEAGRSVYFIYEQIDDWYILLILMRRIYQSSPFFRMRMCMQ